MTSNRIISFVILSFCIFYSLFAFSSQDEEVYFYEVKSSKSLEPKVDAPAEPLLEADESELEQSSEPLGQVTFHEERFLIEEVEGTDNRHDINNRPDLEQSESDTLEDLEGKGGSQSGEKRDSLKRSKPVLYLSFDDGPSKDRTTEGILALLDEYGVPATFFITGVRSGLFPEKIKQILDQGHYIGNHSYYHNDLTKMKSPSEIRESLGRTSDSFYQRYGVEITCFRPPYGHIKKREREIVKEMGLNMVLWDHDSQDWQKSQSREDIAHFLDNRLSGGGIVLFHDGPNRRRKTLEALRDWLPEAIDKYEFLSLETCRNPSQKPEQLYLD